jgi:hypothetical protein
MGVQYQAANVKFPEWRSKLWDGTTNTGPTPVILYTADTTHKVHELPEEFRGKFIRIYADGGDLHFVFSDSATHEVDRTLAASDAGTRDPKLGGFCANGDFREGRVMSAPKDGAVYFAREGSALMTVLIEVVSD